MVAMPTLEKLRVIGSWTMRPPKIADAENPSNIGVIILGQFCVYGAAPERVPIVNEAMGTSYKAGVILNVCKK